MGTMTKPVVTCSQLGRRGRLGNQFFQIAATIGAAMEHGYDYVFPAWALAEEFESPIPQVDRVRPASTFTQGPFYYQPILLDGNTDLQGLFQNEKYFEHCAGIIRRTFTLKEESRDYITKAYRPFTKDTCSIHVRRTDYVGSPFMQLLDMDYYEKAIAWFSPETRFVVFSDDIAWWTQHFCGPRFSFVEGEPALFDMFIMASCADHIIANSSFSWWGAWLDPNPHKTVIGPTQWFKDDYTVDGKHRFGQQTYDVLPGRWRRVI
jgi:hypothetical protein